MNPIRSAVAALDEAAVPHSFPSPQPIDDPPRGGDVDILVSFSDLAAADERLRAAGFFHCRVPGHAGHRFYLAFQDGRWMKIDLNIVPRLELRPLRPSVRVSDRYRTTWKARFGSLGAAGEAMARRRPLSLRRVGPVIAFLGPDGSGKGSVIDSLKSEIPLACKTLYLGQKKTRRGSSDARSVSSTQTAGPLRECAFLCRKLWRMWRLLAPGYVAAWRGHIVLCDRHPIEALAMSPRRSLLARGMERFMVQRLIPWPDAIVVLDAPGEILWQRKGEHTVEILERWRQGYLREFRWQASMISTLDPLEATVKRASEVVWNTLRARRRW